MIRKSVTLSLIVSCSFFIFGFNGLPSQNDRVLAVGTPTPINSTSYIPNIPNQLSFGWVSTSNLQIVGATYECEKIWKNNKSNSPAVIQVERKINSPFSSLCLKGFPPDKLISIDIKTPEGNLIKSLTFQPGLKDGYTDVYFIQ